MNINTKKVFLSIFIVVLLLNLPSFVAEKSLIKNNSRVSLDNTPSNADISLDDHDTGSKMILSEDIVISNCLVNGTILIESDAYVVFENVTFLLRHFPTIKNNRFLFESFMEIHDSAKVIIRNSFFNVVDYDANMTLYDNAQLIIENTNSSSSEKFYLFLFNSSNLTIRQSDMYSLIYLRDFSSAYIEDLTGSVEIAAVDNSQIGLTGFINLPFGSIYLCNYTTLRSTNANVTGYSFSVMAYGMTQIFVNNSSINDMSASLQDSIYIYNSTISYLRSSGLSSVYIKNSDIFSYQSEGNAVFSIENSSIDSIFLDWDYRPHENFDRSPVGEIVN